MPKKKAAAPNRSFQVADQIQRDLAEPERLRHGLRVRCLQQCDKNREEAQ